MTASFPILCETIATQNAEPENECPPLHTHHHPKKCDIITRKVEMDVNAEQAYIINAYDT